MCSSNVFEHMEEQRGRKKKYEEIEKMPEDTGKSEHKQRKRKDISKIKIPEEIRKKARYQKKQGHKAGMPSEISQNRQKRVSGGKP